MANFIRFPSKLVRSFTGLALVLNSVAFLLFLCPIIYIYRFLVCKAVKILSPSMGEIVDPRGHYFATEDFTSGRPSRSALIVSIAVKGHLTLEEVRYRYLNHLVLAREGGDPTSNDLKYPELQQYITSWPSVLFGFRFWKPEENFSIDDHVNQYHGLKGSPSSNFTDDDHREMIQTLLNQPFKPNQSPWEIFVTNKYVNPDLSFEEMTLVTAKTHHCLADGFGLSHTVFANLGDGFPLLPKPGRAKVNQMQKFWRCLSFPVEACRFLSELTMLSFDPHPWKVSDKRKKWKQNYWKSGRIPVGKIKVIKNKFNVSFASVLLSAYSAAASTALIKDGYDVNSKTGSRHVPCASVLPLPNHPRKFRNYCTAACLSLPTLNLDPVQRLMECNRQFKGGALGVQPLIAKYLPVLIGNLTTGLCNFVGTNRQIPVGFSNFPISEKRVEYLGREALSATLGGGGQQGVLGVNLLVYSYADHIEFTVSAEDALFSSSALAQFIQRVTEEIEFLYKVPLAHRNFG